VDFGTEREFKSFVLKVRLQYYTVKWQ